MITSYLSNIGLSELVKHSNDIEKELLKQNYGATALSDLVIVSSFAYVLGYLIAFIVALFILGKRKFYWLNSTISLVIFWLLGQFDLTGWNHLKNIFLTPGEIANGAWYYVINGSLMIGLGIALLFVANKIVSNTKKEFFAKPSLA